MANKFVGFLEAAGKDFEKGLAFVVKDAPELTGLAALLFPASVAVAPAVTTALTLLQNTVVAVEQKYASANAQSATGVQKASDVVTLAAPAAISLLTSAGVSGVDTSYVNNLVTAIVAILNVKAPVAATA